jgi:uncharacterized protein
MGAAWFWIVSATLAYQVAITLWANRRFWQFWQRAAVSQPAHRPAATGLVRALLARAVCDEVGIRVGGSGLGAFHPSASTVSLAADVAQGNRLADHAVAAHEVGHALQRRDRRWLVILSAWLQIASPLVLALGVALATDALIAARPGLFVAGVVAVETSLILGAGIVLLELDASRRGFGTLRSTVSLDAAEAHAIHQLLRAAALTYLATPLLGVPLLLAPLASQPPEDGPSPAIAAVDP